MHKRGQKSAAELSVVTPLNVRERLAPPGELTADQARIWRDVVKTKPADWFDADSAPLLSEYCRAKTLADSVAEKIDAFDMGLLDDSEQRAYFKDLCKLQKDHANLIAQLAVKMRLTQQSRYTPRASQTANKKAAGARPWEA